MSMDAMYVYAIIPTGDRQVFPLAGIHDNGDDVYSVPYHGIAAIVSTSPLIDYCGLDRKQAATYLVSHQRVVEAVMREFPVLPVRFGTVLPDLSWVNRLLAQGEVRFRAALEKVGGQAQMEIVVLWNLQEVFAEIGQEAKIAELSARVMGRAPEETVAERIAVGQLVQASLKQRRASLQDRLLPPLQEVAQDLVINPLMDDSMVLNAALLVERGSDGVLDRRLALLDQELEGRFHFRCVGPLPPYSFATVEVEAPAFEDVDEARRRLGLAETVTRGEIKQAYRRLAGQFHPDHRPEDPEAEAQMAELTEAYELLNAYAGSEAWRERLYSRAEKTADTSLCQLDRRAVEETFLISVRRQEVA
jgi:hypothetical protein